MRRKPSLISGNIDVSQRAGQQDVIRVQVRHDFACRPLHAQVDGLCLTLIHLVTIPVTNTSVNPARSTGQALFVGDWAVSQLWMFWVAPIVGAVIAGVIAKKLND